MRVERQVLVGLPEVYSVIFLIRTFVTPIDELRQRERSQIYTAVAEMTDEELEYKGMTKWEK